MADKAKPEAPAADQAQAELSAKLTTTEAQLAAAEAGKQNLQEEVKSLKAVADTLTKDNAKLKGENEKKDKAIGKLMEQMAKAVNGKDDSSVSITTEAKAVETPKDAVTVNGEQYRFKKPFFSVPGVFGVQKSEEAMHNEELLQKLVGINGQTVLEKIA